MNLLWNHNWDFLNMYISFLQTIYEGNYLFRCCFALHWTALTAIYWRPFQRIFGVFFVILATLWRKLSFLCCFALHCTDSHMLKPISKDDVGIQCEFMMCSAQRKTKIGYYVPTILYSTIMLNDFLKKQKYSFFCSCLFKGLFWTNHNPKHQWQF